jgi:deoxyribodipyrimidine photo-lyase
MIKNARVKILKKEGTELFVGDDKNISGSVLYWMNREMRTDDNWSLYFAQDLANKNNQQLIVVYNLVTGFLGGQNRHLTFKIDALIEIEKKLLNKNIPFCVLVDKTASDKNNFGDTPKMILDFCKENKIGALVTDFYPLNLPKKWNQEILSKIEIPFFEVDSHNIVPSRELTEKKEYAARTIRPKIHKQISEFLEKFPYLTKQDSTTNRNSINTNSINSKWSEILSNENREEMKWIKPGEKEAKKALDKFIKNILPSYAENRNNPNKNGQSNLSPYLHYGMLSAQTITLKVCDWVGQPITEILSASRNRAKTDLKPEQMTRLDHAGAFLEELIIRKELSDNFCLHEKNYDNPACFEPWAANSLFRHLGDEREYVYSTQEFENAETHDDLWNACQMEMVNKGKMHGYMRMYWAKKILEWTMNPKDAMEIAVYLNDKYELDGRDPNGYAGVAWSIGGVHDRPWFDRDIFGQVRYMNRSGCEKKFNVDEYIKNNLNSKLF